MGRDKSKGKYRQHGVSFQEASGVFYNPYARVIDDPDHSLDEERFIILGEGRRARTLAVCHCLRGPAGETVRIISARKATKTEAELYRRYVHEG